MKKLIAGLGMLLLAAPVAQAIAKGHANADDMRTKRANLQKPVVRVKHHIVKVEPCQCQLPAGYRAPAKRVQQQHAHKPQATGWQRAAKVVPQLRQTPQQWANTKPIRTKVKATTSAIT